ncbi:tyrosine-protein phosphatase [Nocardia sp. NBC_00565]|uniref:tyrosine-protein phosphatase n=1 Tax=Nocardia sp. NBC_00565 TaxID=2975993 RepID=UPI002E80DD7D|nr:tyrosine-protein phosphatase [Nocardia sp. NBC_00565]WUC07282.1 tyrosine-protein phosphatase [Nocardia sp. NBC_00565]
MVHRSMRVPVALAAGLTVAFAPVAGVALADPVSVADTTVDRSLNLQGVQNGRDAGGYRTTDGRWIRTGLVYRTGQLNNATLADLAELSRRDIRFVDDLRTVYERTLGPDRIPPGATAQVDDVIGQAPPQTLITTLTGGNDLYRAFITAPGANEAFTSVLRDIIDTKDGAVLYHCTAGKDRTGWTSAVLLTILGVDRDTVTQDYLLSNQYRNANPNDPLNGVSTAWLDAAFDQANQTYGSFDNYVRDGLQLSADDVAALKAKMLA